MSTKEKVKTEYMNGSGFYHPRLLLKSLLLPEAVVHFFLLLVGFFIILSCQPAFAETASFYGNGEKLNKYTANGEVFDPAKLTCATYNYPFNTILKVTNLENGKVVYVKVNDKGPAKRLGRAIDLTREAFSRIASLKEGLIEVKIERINHGK